MHFAGTESESRRARRVCSPEPLVLYLEKGTTMPIRSTMFAVAVALTATTGCYKATFYQDPRAVAGEEHDRWSDFFVFGLVGTEDFDTRDYCEHDDVAEVRTGANFGTAAVSVLTIGIYTPRKFYITCAKPASGGK